MRFLTASILLAAAAPALAAPNLVTNGNFEAGNTGFTSGYTYVSPGPGQLVPEGVYTVDTNPANSHPQFASYGDHTSGSGLFMIVNGAPQGNTQVWGSGAIAVQANTNYSFSAWISSAFPDNPGQLLFTINPNVGPAISIGPVNAPGTTGVWTQVGGVFNTGAATSLTLASIVDINTVRFGNDFGIDDITLSAVPEPATWGLMIAGFGMIGFAARRHRQAVVAA